MREIGLYINGVRMELDTSSLILYNYTKDDATNPTIVKNSYTQKVTIPGTPTNNKVFNFYYNNDYQSWFNPFTKVPFEIRNELSEVLESGYVKLESVERKGEHIVNYTISLYGGLGGLFYHLSYKADGTEKTLADLLYNDVQGQGGGASTKAANLINYHFSKSNIASAWQELGRSGGVGDEDEYDLINYVPCYNGLPSCKFSADKAIYTTGTGIDHYPNLYLSSGDYSAPLTNTILIEMEKEHDEWQMQDLRSYLQRPAISVRGLLKTIAYAANTGDYTLVLDANVFNANNKYFYYGWITLPMFDRDNIEPSSCKLSDLLKGTKSPAKYLIDYAKLFGYCFVYSAWNRTITLTSRSVYYSQGHQNIDERIDRSSMTIQPTTISKRYYTFAYNVDDGEFVKAYNDLAKVPFASTKVDTNYQFSNESEELYSDNIFKGAVDLMQSSGGYVSFAGAGSTETFFKYGLLETCSWDLYKTEDDELKSETFYPLQSMIAPFNYSGDNTSYKDFLPKPQMRDKDNKCLDGSNVLLFFHKFYETPIVRIGTWVRHETKFYLTDDRQDMLDLNDGIPCWEASMGGSNVQVIDSIPSFRRGHWNSTNNEMDASFDFIPTDALDEGIEQYDTDAGLFGQYWKGFMADRLNSTTRVVTCKVDFKGQKVDESLLRYFYHFDNSVWVLNKIKNYCITSDAPVECEFIKVQNISNYQ